MEHYLNIIFESAWTSSVIPFGHEPTFFSMLSFGGFNMPVAAALAIFGASAGQAFNWWIGKILKGGQEKQRMRINPASYEKAAHVFNKYLIWCLLFSWAPLFKVLVLLSGFLGGRFSIVMPLVVIGQIGYYCYFLLP